MSNLSFKPLGEECRWCIQRDSSQRNIWWIVETRSCLADCFLKKVMRVYTPNDVFSNHPQPGEYGRN
ncbi:hypothetical protein DPEC_G00240570 [Dallia pectoralis]|uniref:Uncharacterized protein n=1 Tax=Dallia pectoralis TaxID=75939 RepID=A0ACC2FZV6_DALPE|nr:hypothetical protein DPEC_G00240570 [Dallia pectoralis]